MKLKFLPIALLFLLSLLSASAFADIDTSDTMDEVGNLTGYNANITAVRPGSGFSTDMDRVAPTVCWDATEHTGGLTQDLSLNQSYDYEKLEKSLGISLTTKGGYGMFSASANANYLRSLEETSLSIGFGYEASISQTVDIEVDWLNDKGTSIYDNPNTQPYFRMRCGDKVYDGPGVYGKGSKLIVAYNIQFNDRTAKEEFSANFSAKYGPFVSMGASIESFAKQYNINGSISLRALQIGGRADKLGEILKADDDGYYATTCSLQNMADCNLAIKSIIDYAAYAYPAQLIDENGNLNDTATYMLTDSRQSLPVEYYGIDPGPSQVTPEVKKARLELAEAYQANKYYLDKLIALRDYYPIKFPAEIKTKIDILTERATQNDKILMGDSGAVECFTIPGSCVATKDTLLTEITPITADDLDFILNQKEFKYKYSTFYADNPGVGQHGPTYMYNGLDWGADGSFDHPDEWRLKTFTVTPTKIEASGTYNEAYPFSMAADSTDGETYNGILYNHLGNPTKQIIYKEDNPYYFTPYQQ